eukprot:scaffold144348_cov19-Tisochrysis_lutea.AAC.2
MGRDGMESAKDQRIVVMGATNRPCKYELVKVAGIKGPSEFERVQGCRVSRGLVSIGEEAQWLGIKEPCEGNGEQSC